MVAPACDERDAIGEPSQKRRNIMNLITQFDRWEPFRDLATFRQKFNHLFDSSNETFLADHWAPTTDVTETEKAIIVSAELPGMKQEDVSIELENGILNISGERKLDEEKKGRNFHRIERSYGKFMRAISLPPNVDTEKISASFDNGLLEVEIPKNEEARPKKIALEIKKKLPPTA
jgi:HSP20 family protein